ncbi:MAG: GH3 auxin-responsive promoter family protein [Bacteroidota bacterium]
MGLKSKLSKPFAKLVAKRIKKESAKAVVLQEETLQNLLQSAKNTAFGKDHNFTSIKNYEDFKKQVPVTDYEGLKPYVERIIDGEENVLWPGVPLYFCKTSGTTSGTKYIPLSKESMPHHIAAARNAILLYIAETGKADFVDGKMIFLQGSPELDTKGKIPFGRLSGIVAHYVPGYLQKNRMPSWKTNCIEDWEEKLEKIIDETLPEKMALISGIPPWVQMYFERIQARTGKQIKDVFPNFSLFIQGGVNYKPYVPIFDKLVGKRIDTIELYPASEGFIAYQDSQKVEGMLLNINAGIFFEFIPADEFFNENPTRISLKDVQINTNYVIILNTNAGMWGYNIGDTVKFTSIQPYRIVVTGRIKHFISAFGEHVIGEEVDKAMIKACAQTGAEVTEFTVAPQVDVGEGLPYHEWFIEFAKKPEDIAVFRDILDKEMTLQNTYYKDLIKGNILQKLVLREMEKNAFVEFMKSVGKLGGQNKIPRLSNDRKIADELHQWMIK